MTRSKAQPATAHSRRIRGLEALPPPLRDGAERARHSLAQAMGERGLTPPSHPDFLDVLDRVWACSAFVAESCVRDPRLLPDLLASGDLLSDYAPAEWPRRVGAAIEGAGGDASLGSALRRLRRREMVRIVWRDLAGWAGLEQTLRDLTGLADACIEGALGPLEAWLRAEHGTPRSEDGQAQSLVVIAMGKQGAGELNVSSDVDLIFAFGQDGETDGERALSNDQFFTRLGQRLIRVLDEPTAEGFVFRVDMRLRPYGESGPLAMSLDAMEDYYQSQGREWERYAMIKARVVAGDRDAGRQLMDTLRPFVYRRYLDFGVFESLRAMKEMIMRQVARKGMERNIKLGPGGIREVEFIGQAFQLVRGGREPVLQARGIMTVLRRLVELGYLPGYVGEGLLDAYRFLRRVENRLQGYADRQVHDLPGDPTECARLAFAMGYSSWDDFARALEEHRRVVREHFAQVFAAPQAEHAQGRGEAETRRAAVWHEALEETQAIEVLREAGFETPQEALALLAALREGHAYRGMGTRGRDLLDRLMPMLLGAAGATARPGQTLLRLARMLEAIARRTAYLSLLVENPMALSQLVKLCAASPWIAALLTQHPLLLDELLDPRALYSPLTREALRRELAGALAGVDHDDLEQQMEVLRHFKQANVLRVAAADVAEAMPLMVVSDHLTEIAEVVLEQVLAIAWRDLAARHGVPPKAGGGGETPIRGFCIIAYGKLGGFELGYGSDLDLVFLHDGEEGETGGARPVDAAVFYARLGQRIIHILNTFTPSGVLYQVDTRLRPSGSAGLLVSGMDAFAEYQRDSAWTWEHQALVRARPVAGDPALGARFDALRREILGRSRDRQGLRAEVRGMRERMRGELAKGGRGRLDLKQGRGGITDIEFLVQYAVLAWTWKHPDLARFTDNIRQLEALARNGLMSAADAERLADAYRAYRQRIHELTLQEEAALVDAEEYAGHRETVVRLWQEWMEESRQKAKGNRQK